MSSPRLQIPIRLLAALIGAATVMPLAQAAPAEAEGPPPCARAIRDQANPGSCLAAARTPTLGALFPLSPNFFIDAANGNVGIGTLRPATALDVRADEPAGVAVSGEGGTDLFSEGGAGVSGQGGVGLFGGNGVVGTGGNADQSDGGAGVRGVGGGGFDGFGGNGVEGVAGGGGLGSGWGVFAFGSLGATGSKSFVQPHPRDPSREIRFVSLEGNETGTYFRGTGRIVNGRAVIEVPEEFRLTTAVEGLTVQLTPVGGLALLAVESQDLQAIQVLGSADVAFHYFVNGVRRGFEETRVVTGNRTFVPRLRGVPFGEYLPEAVRRMLVENGTLNDDFTPNEGTAARMGWTLADPH